VADQHPLWERQAWDTAASFKAFRTWLLQEQRPRSLDAAYRQQVGREWYAGGTRIRASDTWRRWYQAKGKDGERIPGARTWEERARAYDDHLAEQERLKWEARRREVREADWQAGEALRDLAAQILAQTPQFLRTTRRLVKGKNGQPDREVITIGISADTMVRVLKLASELQQQAAEVQPPVQEVRHRHSGAVVQAEVKADDDPDRIAAILNVLAEVGAIPPATAGAGDAAADEIHPPRADPAAGGVPAADVP